MQNGDVAEGMFTMPTPKIRLYSDLKFQAGSDEGTLMPIVWAQIDKVSEEERLKKHHARATHFELVSKKEDADWFVLPDTWNTYANQCKIDQAQAFASVAARHGKLILVWAGGDPEYIVPISNAIIVQEGLHRNLPRKVAFAFECPGFVEDFVQLYLENNWHPLTKRADPIVGFCGLAKARLRSRIHYYVRNTAVKLKYYAGRSDIIPIIHGFPIDLRAKTLRLLQQHPGVKTNFIIRNRYLAGVRDPQLKNLAKPATSLLIILWKVCIRFVCEAAVISQKGFMKPCAVAEYRY